MEKVITLVIIIIMLSACDSNRLYETNIDFEDRYWLVSEQPSFDFEIDDTTIRYNLYINIRNEVSYPKSNLYFTYYLEDTTSSVLEKKLLSKVLFNEKSGAPFGSSVLGDIYDHQLVLLENYQFNKPGKYIMRYEQFMRMDTLPGVLAIGLRVEKALPQ